MCTALDCKVWITETTNARRANSVKLLAVQWQTI